jgi:prepilin-type N-terminal cleavage/methylation domain-containing protein
MRRQAFTLVELLVVIAIIGLLSSIAIVSMSGSRDKARIAAGLQSDTSIEHKLSYESAGSWPLDEGTGTAIADATGPSNSGTLSSADGSTWVTGVKGKAIDFNGANYVTMSKPITLPLNSFTVTAWFKTSASGMNMIFSLGNSGPRVLVGYASVNSFIRLCGSTCSSGSESMNDGRWHFLAMTGDDSSIRAFIDGKLQVTQGPSSVIRTGIPRIGSEGAGDGSESPGILFRGSIDEVKTYSQAMTAMEIQRTYMAGKAAHADALAAR